MFDTVVERLRSTEGLLRQSERMAQLGTLTAGVAQELNALLSEVAGAARAVDEIDPLDRSDIEYELQSWLV